MAVAWYLCRAISVMWQFSQSRDSMVVADGLVPIWCQDTCNHPDDVARRENDFQSELQ